VPTLWKNGGQISPSGGGGGTRQAPDFLSASEQQIVLLGHAPVVGGGVHKVVPEKLEQHSPPACS
jgi:hypothetical protein